MGIASQRTSSVFEPYGFDVTREKSFRFDVAHVVSRVIAISKQLKTAKLSSQERDQLFLQAVSLLQHVRSLDMSNTQLIQVNYAYATLYAVGADLADALHRLGWVLGAVQGDPLAQSTVLKLSGEVRHRGGDLVGAHDDYLQSFTNLQRLDHDKCLTHNQADAYVNVEMELDVVVRLCNIELDRAEVKSLDKHTKIAHHLFEYVLDDVSSYKTRVAWIEAQQARCEGKTDAARQHALKVVSGMSAHPGAAYGRALVMLMDITLDLIANPPQPEANWRALLHETDDYAMRARHIFEDYPDAIGANLLEQAKCQADRLERGMSGMPADLNNIMQTVENAERLEDAATIARAFTALGAEQEMAGKLEDAKQSYQFADHRLRSQGFQSLCAWPQDALKRLARSNAILV